MRILSPPAQLARCYRSGEHYHFSINKARDINKTVSMLTEQIPSHDCRYDPLTQEWQVHERHANLLETLFVNFPTVLRGQSGVYIPLGNSPHNNPGYRPSPITMGATQANRYVSAHWLSLLVWIGIAVICVVLWPWLTDGSNPSSLAVRIIEQQATPTVAAVIPQITPQQATQLSRPRPTPTPASAIVLQTANLRAGPGTDYAIQDLLEVGQSIEINGQALVPDSVPWYRIESGLWIYSPLVSELDESPRIIEVVVAQP